MLFESSEPQGLHWEIRAKHSAMEGLPTEIVLQIASYLNIGDAKCLRESSKRLADGAAGRVFNRIKIRFNEDVFKELLEFAKLPHVGRYIVGITIVPDLSRPALVSEWIAKSLSEGAILPDALGCLNLRDTGTPWLLQWLYNRSREAGDWVDGKMGYWERHRCHVLDATNVSGEHKQGEHGLSTLANVFGHLPNLHHVRFDDECETDDVRELQGQDFWMFDTGTTWRYHIVRTVLEAMTIAGRSPQSITVASHYGESYPAWMLNDLRLLLPAQIPPALGWLENLQRLQFISLATSDNWHPSGSHKALLSTAELGQLICGIPKLEELELHFSGPKPSISFWDLDISINRAHKLRKFTLSNIEVEYSELSIYLNVYCRTMEYVHMQHVVLSNGHWVKLLDSMRKANHSRLSSLMIQECFSKGAEGADLFEEDPELHQKWSYKLQCSHELVDYVRCRTPINPWFVRYAIWFPHLWRTMAAANGRLDPDARTALQEAMDDVGYHVEG